MPSRSGLEIVLNSMFKKDRVLHSWALMLMFFFILPVVTFSSYVPQPETSIQTAAEAAAALLRGEGKKLQRKDRKAEIGRIRAELGLADAGRTPLV